MILIILKILFFHLYQIFFIRYNEILDILVRGKIRRGKINGLVRFK